MPYLPVVYHFLPRRRVVLLALRPPRRLGHSEAPRQHVATPAEVIIGIVVIFSAFLTPAAYVLSNMNEFRRG